MFVVDLEELIELLKVEAREFYPDKELVMYHICFRNAGVGIQWYDEGYVGFNAYPPNEAYKAHLVVHDYYPTLRECIEGELKRLKAIKVKQ